MPLVYRRATPTSNLEGAEMTDETTDAGIRDRIQRQGEEAIGKVVGDLLENPLFTGALGRALEAREKANEAQQAAMAAFNVPSAADLSRLTRRVRSVGQRLEGVEDALDRLERLLGQDGLGSIEDRLANIETAVEKLSDKPAAKPAAKKAAPKKAAPKKK